MRLITCPACGKPVSKAAATCPSCGHPTKRGLLGRPGSERALNVGCLVVILVVISLFIAGALSEAKKPKSSDPFAVPSFAPATPSIDTFIQLSIRPSVISSSSGVLQIHNDSDQSLSLKYHVKNHDNQQQGDFAITVAPKTVWETGWTYGWDFQPNEEISIGSDGYESATWLTTKMDNGEVGIHEKGQ